MKEMDLALEDLMKNKNQQLRDSITTIKSVDRAAITLWEISTSKSEAQLY